MFLERPRREAAAITYLKVMYLVNAMHTQTTYCSGVTQASIVFGISEPFDLSGVVVLPEKFQNHISDVWFLAEIVEYLCKFMCVRWIDVYVSFLLLFITAK